MTQSQPQILSTGQAAKLCAVTRDTILKWIRGGRLPAQRTPGGHHRIKRQDLERILRPAGSGDRRQERAAIRDEAEEQPFHYCWDFFSTKGSLRSHCESCTVFQTRAKRCYELARLAPDLGNTRTFCSESCEDCDYYRAVQRQGTNVLVISDDTGVVARLRRRSWRAPFALETADCEYTASAIVDSFRPDFVVIDCGLGAERSRDIRQHLIEDPRIPFVRLILAAAADELPESCEHDVFAFLDKPFAIEDLVACIGMIPRDGRHGSMPVSGDGAVSAWCRLKNDGRGIPSRSEPEEDGQAAPRADTRTQE